MILKVEGTCEWFDRPKIWHAKVPVLQVSASGETKQEFASLIFWKLGADPRKFKLEFSSPTQFNILAKEPAAFIPVLLSHLRHLSGLTVQDASDKMGWKSRASYFQYESGHRIPSFDQFEKLIDALDPHLELVLRHADSSHYPRQ